MAVTFSRFSSLGNHHFRAAWFGQRVAELYEDLAGSRDLVQGQCLFAIVAMTAIAYLLVRGLDSLWALALIMPLLAISGACLQHALTIYRCYMHAFVMPSLCEAFGRLRHSMGATPELAVHRLINSGLLPEHERHLIDDVFSGDYRGQGLTLALVNVWRNGGDMPPGSDDEPDCRVITVTIQWPERPPTLPTDELSEIIGGHGRRRLIWADGLLMLALPCAANPFDLGGLFQPPERLLARLHQVASILQIPANLIDHFLDGAVDRSVSA